tara:strand:- start:3416 stop:3745 length:330 start_codon:yes stop_codon:yes gene_type:complete
MTKAQERALTENDMTKIVFSGFEKTGRHLPQIQTAHFNEVKDEFKFAEIHQTFQHSQRINSYVVCYQTHCLRRHFPFIRQIDFSVQKYGTARRALAAAKRYCIDLGQRD